MRSRASESGFTLVELVVVMIIIAALAAVIVPRVFTRVEQGRRAKAISDIKSSNQAFPGKSLQKPRMRRCPQNNLSSAAVQPLHRRPIIAYPTTNTTRKLFDEGSHQLFVGPLPQSSIQINNCDFSSNREVLRHQEWISRINNKLSPLL